MRTVRQILVTIDEEMGASVSLLRDNEYDAAVDILLEGALAEIKDTADKVLGLLKAGEITFDEALTKYSEDSDMPQEGYPVTEGTSNYVEPFTLGAMNLENIGDFSDEIVQSDFGYHIIEYFSDVEEGAIDFYSVYQIIYDELADSMQSEAWTEIVTDWESAVEIEYFYENLE